MNNTLNIALLGRPYLAAALRKQGHTVFTVSSVGHADIMLQHPLAPGRLQALFQAHSFTPDAVALCDDGCLPAILGLEDLPWPSIFFSIDTFCNPWHVPYAHAFDHCLVAQKDFVPLFTDAGHAASWFPLFAYINMATEAQSPEQWLAERDIPVAFVGTLKPKNIPHRLPFLKTFRQSHPLVMMQGDYAPVFRRARMVLNQSASSEVNFRCFEAMACGCALLHDSIGHGFSHLFAMGTHVLPPYPPNNAQSAANIARHWLNRPHELAKLALAGAHLVASKHSDEARARELSTLCHHLIQTHAHQSRLAKLAHHRIFLSSAYGTLAAELGNDKADLRDLYEKACVSLHS